MHGLQRVCVKVFASEFSGVRDQEFIPVFHEWITQRALDRVLLDVADYSHVPAGPGMMLVTHEESYALDRSDGRFGLHVQRRRAAAGDAAAAIETVLRHVLEVAALLERDARLSGRIRFDDSVLRVEANDRLRAPNTSEAYAAFQPLVRSAVSAVWPSRTATFARADNDPRDRLAVDVKLVQHDGVQSAYPVQSA